MLYDPIVKIDFAHNEEHGTDAYSDSYLQRSTWRTHVNYFARVCLLLVCHH